MKYTRNKFLMISSIVCVLALMIMIFALSIEKEVNQAPYIPPSFDPLAKVGIPEVPTELGWTELNAKVFRVSLCGVISLYDSAADVWLLNHADNDVWIKLRVMDVDGTIFGETGLLTEGSYVQAVTLNIIPETGTPVVLKIMAYEPETYYSAGSISINTYIY